MLTCIQYSEFRIKSDFSKMYANFCTDYSEIQIFTISPLQQKNHFHTDCVKLSYSFYYAIYSVPNILIFITNVLWVVKLAAFLVLFKFYLNSDI